MTKADIDNIWAKLIEHLSPSFSNKNIFETCIQPSRVSKFSGDTITVIAPTIFAKSLLTNDYSDKITSFFEQQLNKRFEFKFILPNETSINNIDSEITKDFDEYKNYDTGLNPEYTLENFIVGDFNKSAYNAICAISKNLGAIYNPLFIYGSTGLGKTHLINGLGNLYKNKFPNKKIKYIESNDFTRDVFQALTKGGNFVEELKHEYSSYDLLLIDDIQYLAGKEKTNEIFFNIFNNLVRHNKQIIITSDKNPEQLDSLEERMVSRFSSGLTIKIESPESEVLKRIIVQRIKQQDATFNFQDEAIDEIVKYYNNDLRKLLGFLNKVSFFAIQNLQPNELITKSFIQEFFEKDGTRMLTPNEDFNPELIISTVCRWYGAKEELVKGKTRLKNITTVRHICMYILRVKYNMSLSDIGSYFSNRDHTTVLSAIEKVNKLAEKDEDLKDFLEKNLNKI